MVQNGTLKQANENADTFYSSLIAPTARQSEHDTHQSHTANSPDLKVIVHPTTDLIL